MHRIAGYIEKLLAVEECVMIPSFGSIIKETLSPQYIKFERIAYPGKVVYYFIAELKGRDNLLESYYAKNYGISMRRARLMVDNDIREMKEQLLQHQTFQIGNIGQFTLLENGKLIFSPQKNEHSSEGDLYGLISYPLLSTKKIYSLKKVSQGNRILQTRKKYLYIKIHKRVIGYAAAGIILLGASLPFSHVTIKDRYSAGFSNPHITKSSNTNLPDSKVIHLLTNSIPTTLFYQSQLPIVCNEQKLDQYDEASNTAKTNIKDFKHYVIIAAFFSEMKAQHYIQENDNYYSIQGYFKYKNRYLVYAYRSNNKEEAYNVAHSLRNAHKNLQYTWVLNLKKTSE